MWKVSANFCSHQCFIFNFPNALISKILNIYPSTPVWNKSKCNQFLDSLKSDVFNFTSCSINKCVSIDYFLKIWTLHPVRKCKIFLHVKILEIIKDIRKFSVDAGTPRVDFGCTLHSKLMHVECGLYLGCISIMSMNIVSTLCMLFEF